MKRMNKKGLGVVIIIVLLLLLIGTIGAYYLINGKKEPIEHLVYDEFDAIGGKINDSTYFLLGASDDISFDIIKEKNFSYEVTDSEGKKVTNQTTEGDTIKIKAPADLYKEGMTYHLKVTNGKFKDDKYKGIKEIIFKVGRPAKQIMTIKENLPKVDVKDVEINNDIIKLTGEYKENDIILVYDKDMLKGSYKLGKKESDNKYIYTIPDDRLIFDEIDYYGKERINLSEYASNKDFNLFLNSLIHTVYAKEDVAVSKPIWNKKDGTLEVGISIYTSNKKEFLANHDAKIELTLVLYVDLYKDIKLNETNYALAINYDIKVKNNLNYSNNSFNNFYEAIKFKDNVENYDTKWLEDSYTKLENDKKVVNKSFGTISVKTEIPGLYLDIDTGILMDINSKAFLNSSLTSKNTLIIGVNNKELYSDYSIDNKSDINFVGNTDNKIAAIINAKLHFINTFNMNTSVTAGLYTNGKTELKVNNEDDTQTIINYTVTGDSGFFAKYLVSTSDIKEKTLFDNKMSLTKYEKKGNISSKKEEKKEEEKKEDDKITYKYTAEKVREMLQSGYDALAALDNWNVPIGSFTTHAISEKTINVNDNTFTGSWNYDGTVSYSCIYNYVTEDMTCNNFDEAQSYVKGTCDVMYNDYLTYKETGETENEDAKEWENLYSSIEACYYEAIPSSEPTNFKEDMTNILSHSGLTFEDLGVLKEQ